MLCTLCLCLFGLRSCDTSPNPMASRSFCVKLPATPEHGMCKHYRCGCSVASERDLQSPLQRALTARPLCRSTCQKDFLLYQTSMWSLPYQSRMSPECAVAGRLLSSSKLLLQFPCIQTRHGAVAIPKSLAGEGIVRETWTKSTTVFGR